MWNEGFSSWHAQLPKCGRLATFFRGFFIFWIIIFPPSQWREFLKSNLCVTQVVVTRVNLLSYICQRSESLHLIWSLRQMKMTDKMSIFQGRRFVKNFFFLKFNIQIQNTIPDTFYAGGELYFELVYWISKHFIFLTKRLPWNIDILSVIYMCLNDQVRFVWFTFLTYVWQKVDSHNNHLCYTQDTF